jgi:hypothetical protein
MQWLLTREALLAIGAGLVGPVLWTTFESQLVRYIHDPLSQWLFGLPPPPELRSAYRLLWRGNQLIFGLVSAVVFAVPLSLVFRTNWLTYGTAFVAVFVASAVGGMLWAGGGDNIPLFFSLPDTWAMIFGSLVIFWFINRRRSGGLPSNSALDRTRA